MLLKKSDFQKYAKVEFSFNYLKVVVTQPPVLRLLNFFKEFIIECDASGIGLRAILMYEGQPISFYGK